MKNLPSQNTSLIANLSPISTIHQAWLYITVWPHPRVTTLIVLYCAMFPKAADPPPVS